MGILLLTHVNDEVILRYEKARGFVADESFPLEEVKVF